MVHDPASGPVIPKQPPDPIQEMPPDQKPAGQNVQWIPGYWSWDVSRNDYLWVSGIWREPPPNSQWVPGYWHQVDGGNQWVSGTWIPVSTGPAQGQAQAQARPAVLPARRRRRASKRARTRRSRIPTSPGRPVTGRGKGSSYAWRPGFWAAVQPNWIWMPAHYVWTPSGYLFVPGYWDLPVANRGLMFAPVYYPQPVYAQPSFVFTPSISIVGSAVTANLFVPAGTNQYLFGNFYAQNFVSVGITPLVFVQLRDGPAGLSIDPLFSYYAVINVRQNPGWVAQVRGSTSCGATTSRCGRRITYIEQTRLIERNVTSRSQHGHAAQPAGGRTGHAARAGQRSRAAAIAPAGRAVAPVPRAAGATGAGRSAGAGGRRSGRGPAAADEPAALADRGASRGAPGGRPGPRLLNAPKHNTGPRQRTPRPLIPAGLVPAWPIGPIQPGSRVMPRELKVVLACSRDPRPVRARRRAALPRVKRRARQTLREAKPGPARRKSDAGLSDDDRPCASRYNRCQTEPTPTCVSVSEGAPSADAV